MAVFVWSFFSGLVFSVYKTLSLSYLVYGACIHFNIIISTMYRYRNEADVALFFYSTPGLASRPTARMNIPYVISLDGNGIEFISNVVKLYCGSKTNNYNAMP